MRLHPLFALLAFAACGVDGTRDADPPDAGSRDAGSLARDAGSTIQEPDDAGTSPPIPPSPRALFEIVPLDPWGRDLAATITTNRPVPERTPDGAAPGVGVFELPPEPWAFSFAVEAADHESAHFRLTYDGGETAQAFRWSDPTGRTRVASALSRRSVDGREVPVLTLFVGLDHEWFAASGRAPGLNKVSFLMDGEETFASVAAELAQARSRVTWSTWWWESDFELLRPPGHAALGEAQRRPNTVMAMAEASRQVRWRILLNRFWGENADFTATLNTDERLRFHATDVEQNVELILQGNSTAVPVDGQYDGRAPGFRWGARVKANPRYANVTLLGPDEPGPPPWPLTLEAASWHQKAVVVDGKVAFVLGLNTKADDWDGSAHEAYDPRRMNFEATASARADVAARERLPDHQPRKDYGLRLDGPIVRDVDEVLHGRWAASRAAGALYANLTTTYDLAPAPASPPDGVPSQLVVTMPGPEPEMSILETQAKAFSRANELVVIEDQYFRSPIMNDRLVARMLANPGVHLVVVTMDLPRYDPGKKFTYLSDVRFRRLFPDRYQLLTLNAVDLARDEDGDVAFVESPIFIHSKLRIVDDRYLSVGSCNMNNRGYLFEGEMNVALLDRAAVKAARTRVLSNLVGPADAARLNGSGANDFAVIRDVASRNAGIARWWRSNAARLSPAAAAAERAGRWPAGFVYPLEIANDYVFDPGPDLY